MAGPDDTTKALVDTLNVDQVQLFVTSGHATERDWQIGFRYRNGQFVSRDGALIGVDTEGKSARSGGWGYLLGDEGSAFWLGHAAVRQGIRAHDGRGPATTLLDRIAEKLELEIPEGLVKWFYDQKLSRNRVAALASVVEEAANEGDEAASDLLNQAAQHLARAGRAVARQLDFEEQFPFVQAGGVFRACPSLFQRVESSLALPQAEPVRLEGEPAKGAVTLAIELLD